MVVLPSVSRVGEPQQAPEALRQQVFVFVEHVVGEVDWVGEGPKAVDAHIRVVSNAGVVHHQVAAENVGVVCREAAGVRSTLEK